MTISPTIPTATVNGVNVTGDLKKIEITQKILTQGIGSFKLTLFNHSGKYSNLFPADSVVNILLNGKAFPGCNGYLDIVNPKCESDEQHKIHQTIELSGRDYGQDLQNQTVWGVWNSAGTAILEQILAPTEVTFNCQGTAPGTLLYSTGGSESAPSSRAYVSDAVKEVLDLINYEGYVDVNRVLQFFPIGTINSGIALQCVNESLSNNIIRVLSHIEKDQTEKKNIIIATGEQVDDDWTEGNASDYTSNPSAIPNAPSYWQGKTCQISNYSGTNPTLPRMGVYCINSYNPNWNISNPPATDLIFPNSAMNKYWLPCLDWSVLSSGTLSFWLFLYTGNNNVMNCGSIYLTLTDTNGTVILYIWCGTHNSWDSTNPLTTGWYQLSCPVGYDTNIFSWTSPSGPCSQWQYVVSNPSTFNWKVVSIQIWVYDYINDVTACNIYLDGLSLPQNMFAVNDQGSYGTSGNAWCQSTSGWSIAGGSGDTVTLDGTNYVIGPKSIKGFWSANSQNMNKLKLAFSALSFAPQVITFWFRTDIPSSSSCIRLLCPDENNYFEYDGVLYPKLSRSYNNGVDTWVPFTININTYTNAVGSPSLSNCQGIEYYDPNASADFSIWFDGLNIQTKQRHFLISRSDIKVQSLLQNYVNQLAPKRNNVIERLRLTAYGNVGLINNAWAWLPGAYCSVNVPVEQINGNYRFISMTHTIEQETTTDFDHIVELDMVPQNLLLDTQQWSYGAEGATAMLRRLRDELLALQTRGNAPLI
jgi:hypothetical protein